MQIRQIGHRRLAIFEAAVIGVVSGLAAVFLKHGISWVGTWRVQTSHALPAWMVLPLMGLIGGAMSGWLIERFSPEAAGSGIPQVKAVLANVPMPLNLRVALVKLVSVMLSVGSGIHLGRQGPTVQIGAALAAQLSRWIPTSPEYRRQLIAAGAAAGLAAGFNAPIAGVLFVVEEFLQDFSGLTLGTAILASFIGAVVSRLLGGQGLSLSLNLANYVTQFSLQDLPFFLILGLVAGVFGGLFTRGLFVSLTFFRQTLKLRLVWKVAIAGLISGLVIMTLPPNFRDSAALQEFLIAPNQTTWSITLLAFAVKAFLTLLAAGSGAPGGLFAPSLILGAALGDLVGYAAQTLETWVGIPLGIPAGVSPATTYALAGMGAFFSAVTRGPITAIVIVFEITMNFNLVLPLMIGSVVSYLITERLSGNSLYSQMLEWSGIQIDDETDILHQTWTELTAADLMQRRVETLASEMTLSEAVQAFSRSHHRGFPVVSQGKLVGIVTQSDLADTSRRPANQATITLRDVMTSDPVTVNPTAPLTHVLYLLNRYKISRLPVKEGSRLVGIITRADIIRAEADQIAAETQGPQPEPSYCVYQTRSPATGRGRLLVPLSNPQTAPELLKLAGTIARDRQYEIECLHVITLPRHQAPDETAVETQAGRYLLNLAETLGQTLAIPIHTQIRLAHDSAQAFLETIKDRHIDLILMGWKGSTTTPGRIFGNVVDTMVRQAACEVMLVKLTDQPQPLFNRWLIPVAGGPNSRQALRMLPALVQLSDRPLIYICQVFTNSPSNNDISQLQQIGQTLQSRLLDPSLAQAMGEAEILSRGIVRVTPVWNPNVADAVVQLAEQESCDVIMIGASREGLLQQAIAGNIPEAIARSGQQTVILVRGAN
jgi:chloride channel protein, CIC family